MLRPGGRVAYAVMGPPDRNQCAARAALDPMMAPFASDAGGYDLPTELVVVSASVD